jgi:hypothetical protein
LVLCCVATLNVFGGQVIDRCWRRYRHTEWLKFLRKIDSETPKDKRLHLTAANYASTQACRGAGVLAKLPRFNMDVTPTPVSWLNLVERFSFAIWSISARDICSSSSAQIAA